MVVLATAASCLVSSAPTDLEPAKMTAPYLSRLDPNPLKILIIPRSSAATGGTATFEPNYLSFDVVSEDLGSNLYAAVVLDYQPLGTNLAGLTSERYEIPAGHIDDPAPRHVDRMPYTIRAGTEGCHSLTLVVTHSFKGFDPTPADAAKDAAYAVWWVDVDDDPTAPTTLSRCSAAFPRDGGLSGGP